MVSAFEAWSSLRDVLEYLDSIGEQRAAIDVSSAMVSLENHMAEAKESIPAQACVHIYAAANGLSDAGQPAALAG